MIIWRMLRIYKNIKKKIEEILLWVWYLKKYGSQKGCNDQ